MPSSFPSPFPYYGQFSCNPLLVICRCDLLYVERLALCSLCDWIPNLYHMSAEIQFSRVGRSFFVGHHSCEWKAVL